MKLIIPQLLATYSTGRYYGTTVLVPVVIMETLEKKITQHTFLNRVKEL